MLHNHSDLTNCAPGHTAFDDKPWILKLVKFVQDVLAQDRVRVIGVCFGHQIVGRAMGVKVDRSTAGWEAAVTPMELTERGRELFKHEKLVVPLVLRCCEFALTAQPRICTKCTAISSAHIQKGSRGLAHHRAVRLRGCT